MTTTLEDARGIPLALCSSAALEPYEKALYAFRTYRGDPLALLDECIALAPDFAGAYVAKALILMTIFERRFARQALGVLDAGAAPIAAAGARERSLAAAVRRLAEGDWHGGTRALDDVLVAHPRDILALQGAHLMDFFRGDALNLRNRVARVLPHWSAALPGYAHVLGMYAFGLEECNQYPEAEATGRRSLALSPDDCWAVHAVTHVMEMQGRIAEGIDFLESMREHWATPDNGFAFHNEWHLALFNLDRAGYDAALAIYDRVLADAHAMVLPRIDATALLWRLWLEGVDVGERLAKVADAWQADLQEEAGFYAFNDFHAALALAGARRVDALEQLRSVIDRAAAESGANAEMTRLVGRDASDGAAAFAQRQYARSAEKLRAVRDGASRFGGSHAQRDLLTLTLVEAARCAGDLRLASHVAGERLMQKPNGAWGQRIAGRIARTGERQSLAA